MNDCPSNPMEPDRRSGDESAFKRQPRDEEILAQDVSDEALEAASGVADQPGTLPCTAPPCLASTFCENKC